VDETLQAADLVIVDLRVEGVVSPVGVTSPRPSLSWRLEGIRRGARQSAYRIEVASSAAALAAESADLWDSTRIDSDNCVGVPADGVTGAFEFGMKTETFTDLARSQRGKWVCSIHAIGRRSGSQPKSG
jgi:hypothetical protein